MTKGKRLFSPSAQPPRLASYLTPMNSSPIRVSPSLRLAGFAATLLCLNGATISRAADISLISDGAFADVGGWSNSAAPTAGNNYFSQQFRVVTAVMAGGLTFAGDRLTIGNGATSGSLGTLVIRNAFGTTITDLRLNNGVIQNGVGQTPSISGNITLAGFGRIHPSFSAGDGARNMWINASIGGSGELRIKSGNVTLRNANNTYSGGTLLESGGAFASALDVQKDGALGLGDVTMQVGSTLKLNLGTTHNYISDSASLIFATGLGASSVTMSFTGTDTIGGLSFDGGATGAASGTWGAIGSGAINEHAIFTGTGLFNVVSAIPEPSAAAALVGVAALGCTALRRRRIR